MLKTFLITGFIAISVQFNFAQRINYESGWNPGFIILNNNEYLKGELNYHQQKENIYFRSVADNTYYPAGKVKYFQFYDIGLKHNRAFKAFKIGSKAQNQSSKIFEVVLEGKIPLYRKFLLVEKAIVKREKDLSNHEIGDFTEYVFFIYVNDQMIEIENFGNDVLPYMKNKMSEISHYISEEKLDPDLQSDQVRIVDYYNALAEKTQ